MIDMREFLHSPNPAVYHSDNYVVLDFEGTNKDKGSALNAENRLLLSCWYRNSDKIRKSLWGGEFDVADLIHDIEDADFLVAHNAKFELQWLARAGLDLRKVLVWCTMIGDYVRYGNERKPLGLGPMAERYGYSGKEPYVDLCMKGGVCPSELPKSMLENRCQYDVAVTHGIFLKQRKILTSTNKLGVMLTRCILTPVLADMEGKGVFLDAERVLSEHRRARAELADVSEKLEAICGGVNLASPKQVGELLYEKLGFKELSVRGQPARTASGGYKTDSATIAKLKPTNKKQRQFLELKKEQARLNAELTKTLNSFKKCVDNKDLLMASFNQTRTATHRLSSSGRHYGVQFQNFPRKFKKLIAARKEGWLVGEIDGAQLEFRVAAFVGQDPVATQDIRDGTDVHSYTASVMTAHGQETARQEAKAHTFKPLYGGESGTEAEQAYYRAFKEKYKGVAEAQNKWIDQAIATGKVVTCTGLEFFYPGTKMLSSGHVVNKQAICNYSVQSLATADIIPIALWYLWHGLHDEGLESFITNTVHDSAIMEIKEEEIDAVRELSVDCFTHKVYNYLYKVYGIKFNVPLGTGFKAGPHWGEGEEITNSVEPPNFED